MPAADRLRVLLVDDDAVDRLSVRRALRQDIDGGRVRLTEAQDGATALAALCTGEYDCVLLDFRLTDTDALGLLAQMSERGVARHPVVILTGFDDEETAHSALRIGAQDYLVKGKTDRSALLRSMRYAIERHRNQQELEQAHATLELRNRDLDDFAGRVAHDIRNSLMPLSAAIFKLRREPVREERRLELADLLRSTQARTTGLIDSLLSFARAGSPSDPNATTSVTDALRGVQEELRNLAEEVGAEVEVEVSDSVVRCEPGLFHAIALNLLSNALKFLPGQSLRRVRISTQEAEGWCELVVADTGPGIPIEEQAKIFGAFYRIPGSGVPGTGIGLATVSRIVGAYGGKVAVESRPGEGATFHVLLPLAR